MVTSLKSGPGILEVTSRSLSGPLGAMTAEAKVSLPPAVTPGSQSWVIDPDCALSVAGALPASTERTSIPPSVLINVMALLMSAVNEESTWTATRWPAD